MSTWLLLYSVLFAARILRYLFPDASL